MSQCSLACTADVCGCVEMASHQEQVLAIERRLAESGLIDDIRMHGLGKGNWTSGNDRGWLRCLQGDERRLLSELQRRDAGQPHDPEGCQQLVTSANAWTERWEHVMDSLEADPRVVLPPDWRPKVPYHGPKTRREMGRETTLSMYLSSRVQWECVSKLE